MSGGRILMLPLRLLGLDHIRGGLVNIGTTAGQLP
jgi:hypothetical protein